MKSTGITVAGSTVAAPERVLANYLANYPGTLSRYDFEPHGEPNVLTVDEIWKTRIINSRFSHAECSELERASIGWASLWAAIPASSHIKDADPAIEGGLYDEMSKLYTLMTNIHGVSTAKASKVLHFKRPHLYPILDRRLMGVYRDEAEVAARHYPSRGFRRMHWAAIRNDVIANKQALRELRRDLATTDPALASLASLSDLRLLDILSWSR